MEKLAKLSEINQVKSLSLIGFNYLIIFLTVMFTESYFHWAIYFFIAMPIIASRLGALGVLMHDASHFRIVKNRKLNEVIGHVFLSWPLLYSVSDFRLNHTQHHRFTNTVDDPDWTRKQVGNQWIFPKAKKDILLMLFKDVIGFGIVDIIEDIKYTNKTKRKTINKYSKFKILFFVSLFATLFFTGHILSFLMYWIIPGITMGRMIIHLRTISDHMAVKNYKHKYSSSRTLIPNKIEEFFLCPHGISYHIEHHLYPSVPVYNLKELHHELMKNPEHAMRAHITYGYRELLDECSMGYIDDEEESSNEMRLAY